MSRIVFIRHGESTGNAGGVAVPPARIPLTERGWEQARQVAASWREAPTLVIYSPYVRTLQTATPTLERFPDIATEEWAIQEFTYLEPRRCEGTTQAMRRPWVESYWSALDPGYQDGPGAESFSQLLRRVEEFRVRVEAEAAEGCLAVFAHSQWMQALRLTVHFGGLTDREKMATFRRLDREYTIPNAGRIEASVKGGRLVLEESVR